MRDTCPSSAVEGATEDHLTRVQLKSVGRVLFSRTQEHDEIVNYVYLHGREDGNSPR